MVKRSNPDGLYRSRFYSQVATVSGKAKTIYIGGQSAVNDKGELVVYGHEISRKIGQGPIKSPQSFLEND